MCSMVSPGLFAATTHKPQVCFENSLHLKTVTVLLSIKSTCEPGASSIGQVVLFPKYDPRGLRPSIGELA